jgi:hypothetical protein
MDWKSVAEPIRALTDKSTPFPWPRTEAARAKIVKTLSEIIPKKDVERACLGNSKEVMNRNLRMLISPYFKSNDDRLVSDISVWIVKEWGGIKKGTESIPPWCDELSGFSNESVKSFIQRMGTTRISSWSKIIAFSSPSTEAIYDARTAVSLNCALYKIGAKEGFFMPAGQNPVIKPAAKLLKSKEIRQVFGYKEYIELLNAISELSSDEDILAVEMNLFANAPSVAKSFLHDVNP